jgi:hypothetical protein
MKAFAMEHPWMTFFIVGSVLFTVRFLFLVGVKKDAKAIDAL